MNKVVKLEIDCIRANYNVKNDFDSDFQSFLKFYLKKEGDVACSQTQLQKGTNPVWKDHLKLITKDLTDILVVELLKQSSKSEKLIGSLEIPLSSLTSEKPIYFDEDIKIDEESNAHLEFQVYYLEEKPETSNNLTYSINSSFNKIDDILSNYKGDDFTFLMSNNKKVKCNKIIADLISPTISKIHKCDPTFNCYDLSFADHRLLEKLLRNKDNQYRVFHDEKIEFNINELDSIIKISDALGNVDLYSQLTQNTELTVKTVVPILLNKLSHENSIESQCIDNEINFISKNFSEIEYSKKIDFSFDILDMIFSNDGFRVNSEDELFDFISQFITQNPECYALLEYVQIEFLTKKCLKKYLEFIDIQSMNLSIWKRICDRLLTIQPRSMIESARNSKKIIHVEYENDKFDGIFQYLNGQCRGNAHVKGIIELSSSGDRLNNCYDIITKNWNNRWFTKSGHFSWWMADFKEMRVALNAYSLKTYIAGDNNYPHLQSWSIQGSNDKETWTIIDKQQPNNFLKGAGYSKIIQLDKTAEPYRYIRLTSEGPDHDGTYYLLLSNIEFFGTIYS